MKSFQYFLRLQILLGRLLRFNVIPIGRSTIPEARCGQTLLQAAHDRSQTMGRPSRVAENPRCAMHTA